jgi:hypothetical protein
MTDRELLEAAAKAAGEWPSPEPFEHVLDRWNPLTNSGDAFELAVKLDLLADGLAGHYDYATDAEYAADPYAATRRAIVRAAAEIGRSKT